MADAEKCIYVFSVHIYCANFMGKITLGLWRLMMQFAKEYDMDKGNSEWYIFDARMESINITSKYCTDKLDSCYHVRYIDNCEEDSWHTNTTYISEILLIWSNVNPSIINYEVTAYSSKRIWNAQITYDWLTCEFIPYVVWYYEVKNAKRKSNFSKKIDFESFRKGFKLDKYLWK